MSHVWNQKPCFSSQNHISSYPLLVCQPVCYKNHQQLLSPVCKNKLNRHDHWISIEFHSVKCIGSLSPCEIPNCLRIETRPLKTFYCLRWLYLCIRHRYFIIVCKKWKRNWWYTLCVWCGYMVGECTLLETFFMLSSEHLFSSLYNLTKKMSQDTTWNRYTHRISTVPFYRRRKMPHTHNLTLFVRLIRLKTSDILLLNF